jgi:hypothetical protein
MKLQPIALGLAGGILWAVAIVVVSLVAANTSYWNELVPMIGQLYVGYDATISGTLIGAIFGFIDAFIGGILLAWLYNRFAK